MIIPIYYKNQNKIINKIINQNKNKLMKFQRIQVYNKFNKTYNNNNKY